MSSCNPSGPLVIHVAKMFPKPDCSRFDAFGRIYSGSVAPNQTVKVLGEGYSLEDEEDSVFAEVSNLYVY